MWIHPNHRSIRVVLMPLFVATLAFFADRSASAQTSVLESPDTFDVSANIDPLAAVRRGHSYVPPGANFTIFGVQGIDLTHSQGDASFATEVNTDFEFNPSI